MPRRRSLQETRRAIAHQSVDATEPLLQGVAKIARHDHLAECIAPVVRGFHQHPPEIAGAADMDAPDRPGRRAQFLKHAQRGQRVDRGIGETQVALVKHRQNMR